MRHAAIVLLATLALAACNPSAPSTEAPAPETADAFPNLLQSSYRVEANVTDDGETSPLVMVRSGGKLRLEFTTEDGPQTIIVNPETQESYMIMSRGGMTMAMRAPVDQIPDIASQWTADLGSTSTNTGTCTVAGQTGAEWTKNDPADPMVACVTSDGIPLRGVENGVTTWEATSVTRGPQDAALFTLPPGVRAMEIGPGMADALEKMQSNR